MNQTSVNLSVSNWNLQTLNTEELEQHIAASIQASSNITVIGARGSGKTAISRQQIQASDHIEAYMNLSMLERSDFAFPNLLNRPKEKMGEEQFVEYILSHTFRPMIEGNRSVILLLDEADKAEKELFAPLYELTHERSINGRKLPNLKACILTGNLISEGGSRPALPLLDRSEAYLVQASAVYWLKWAAASGEIHPTIYTYITDHPNDLSDITTGHEENYKGPSGRGWHLASKLLYTGEKNNWSLELMQQKVSGQIGKKVGLDFKLYYQSYQVLLPLVSRIFANETYAEEYKGLKPTEKLYVSTIVCSRLANILDSSTPENPPTEAINNVGQFLKIISAENVLASVKSQIRPARIVKYNLDENKYWGPILNETQKRSEG